MKTIYDSRYIKLIESLRQARRENKISQEQVADTLGETQSYVSKVEGLERRLDIIELWDWLGAIDVEPTEFLRALRLINGEKEEALGNLPPLPIPRTVKETEGGILQQLAWRGKRYGVFLDSVTPEGYIEAEKHITDLFSALNVATPTLKNREAICEALEYAFEKFPDLNPSDIYQHIVYRLYLRTYNKTQVDRSWVRAGGEAVELFIQKHYAEKLKAHGIIIKALISGAEKKRTLQDMGLDGEVGDSKLDIALYGENKGKSVVFGGIHVKASLAERVSDDVPCSTAMMQKGLVSFLFTFDSKSFPPPNGDLVNRGELGTVDNPSDKRKYIEDHGSFDACFSYNLRSNPSPPQTLSGKFIYVSSFKTEEDRLPDLIIEAWETFKESL